MQFKLVEPLRELFKDEVRRLGELLGLPPEIVWRQPFPGPGLAIRVLGEVTTDRLDLLREADAIVQEEVRAAGLERSCGRPSRCCCPCRRWASWATSAPTRSVIALRAVTSQDAMTADWARLPYDLLGTHQQPDHQRGEGRQPRRLRHLVEAPAHDRVGVARSSCSTPSSSTSTCTPSTACSTAPPSSRSWSRRRRRSASPPSRSPITATSSAPSTSTSPPRRRASSRSSAASSTWRRGAARSGARRTAATRAPTISRCSCGTATGYRNLIKLVSKAYLEGFYYKPRVDKRAARRSTPTGCSSCRGA